MLMQRRGQPEPNHKFLMAYRAMHHVIKPLATLPSAILKKSPHKNADSVKNHIGLAAFYRPICLPSTFLICDRKTLPIGVMIA